MSRTPSLQLDQDKVNFVPMCRTKAQLQITVRFYCNKVTWVTSALIHPLRGNVNLFKRTILHSSLEVTEMFSIYNVMQQIKISRHIT